MSIKKIQTKDGIKLKDTKTKRLAGSISTKGKNAPIAAKSIQKVNGRWRVSLLISHPDVASQAFNWDPSTVTAGCREEREWFCSACGYVWLLEVAKKVNQRGGSKCKVCPRLRGGSVSLASAFPKIAKEAHGWNPNFVTHASAKELPWKCSDCKQIWKMRVDFRTRYLASAKCPCKRNLTLNNLLLSHPILAAEASGWDPSLFTASSAQQKLKWHCSVCTNEWLASPLERVRSPRRWGCLKCSQEAGQKIVIQGQSTLKATQSGSLLARNPGLASELLDPSLGELLSYGCGVKVEWRCPVCDHIWTTPVANRVFGDSGCPKCSIHGFNINEPAFVYFLVKNDMKNIIVQYGITNNLEERIKAHARSGFRPDANTKFLKFEVGEYASKIEKTIKAKLNLRGILSVKEDLQINAKFPGYTESFSQEALPVESLEHLLKVLQIDLTDYPHSWYNY